MQNSSETPLYQRADAPVHRRVTDLLERMTLEEKVGQLVGARAAAGEEFPSIEDLPETVQEYGLGVAAPFGWGGAALQEVEEIVETVNELQAAAVEGTRLGIPLLLNVDAVHGHAYVSGATVLPNGLGAAATWDPHLVEDGAAVTAAEIAATGAHQNYGPTCDVGREPRWGRVFETFGESPRLAASMAAAKVRGYQGDGIEEDDSVVATAKHFPAYGEPARGEDAAPVDVSEYKLRNTFVPPFEAALDAGVESVMPCYNSINGEPVHGSRTFLTEMLRGDLQFDGTVVSDWEGIRHLTEEHRTARDLPEAVYDARTAGVDVASVGDAAHADALLELIQRGDLPRDVLDESVRRLLGLKVRLGLFEDPYVDLSDARGTVGADAHRQVALDTARASMTLLLNDGRLPLSGDERLMVGGPNADDLVNQVGGWSVMEADQVAGTTVLEGLREHHDGPVTYEQGATLTEELDLDAAAAAAAAADVAVLALGEGWYIHEFGGGPPSTDTGSFPTRERLDLPEAQRALVDAVAETGTPVVGVLVTGRPLAVEHLHDTADAVLMAYFPGTAGGQAVAETLTGANEPSGRLPMTVLRSTGQLGQFHDHVHQPRPIGPDEHPPSYDPLYPFGHGESYTSFTHRDVSADSTVVGPGESVALDVTVENVGDRAGTEVVQVYSATDAASIVRPERRLEAFTRVSLDAGETTSVTVEVPVEDLGLYVPDEGHRVAPGDYHLHVGDEAVTVTVDGAHL